MADMSDGRSQKRILRALFACLCVVAASALVGSLNQLLPPGTNYRFEVGWFLIGVAFAVLVLGFAVLFGDAVASAAKAKWRSWSRTKKIVICLTVYVVGNVLGHAGTKLYDHFRRPLYEYLPPSTSWWFQ